MKILKLLFISIFAVSILTTGNSFAKGKDGYITVSKLFVRSKASTSGKKLGSLKLGDKIKIIARSKKSMTIAGKTSRWFKFSYKGKNGWVFGGFVSWKPVLNKKAQQKMLQGKYIASKEASYRILIIKGARYKEQWFNSRTGILDEYRGKVVFQANDITLIPTSRKSRPSVYIDFPRNNRESSIYAYAYRLWDNNPNRLKKLKRLSKNQGRIKLIINNRSKKIQLKSKNTIFKKTN